MNATAEMPQGKTESDQHQHRSIQPYFLNHCSILHNATNEPKDKVCPSKFEFFASKMKISTVLKNDKDIDIKVRLCKFNIIRRS